MKMEKLFFDVQYKDNPEYNDDAIFNVYKDGDIGILNGEVYSLLFRIRRVSGGYIVRFGEEIIGKIDSTSDSGRSFEGALPSAVLILIGYLLKKWDAQYFTPDIAASCSYPKLPRKSLPFYFDVQFDGEVVEDDIIPPIFVDKSGILYVYSEENNGYLSVKSYKSYLNRNKSIKERKIYTWMCIVKILQKAVERKE